MTVLSVTATDFEDLKNEIRDHAIGNGWTTLRDTADELILRGSGTGSDQIFVGLRKDVSIGDDYYNFEVAGFTGFDSGLSFSDQPGKSPSVYSSFWDSSMPAWIKINSRRIIVHAKVSTTYHSLHLGWILPAGLPSEYPYPLLAAGETATQGRRWSDEDNDNRSYYSPAPDSCHLRTNSGLWLSIANYNASSNRDEAVNTCPYGGNAGGSSNFLEMVRECSNGDYPKKQISIVQNDGSELNVLGFIDGMQWTTGFGIGAETDMDTGGGITFQDIHRNGVDKMIYMEL